MESLVSPRQPAILLVSDDARIGTSLRREVEQAGRMVVEAKGQGKALEEVHRAQPAAVVLDLDLAPQGGWKIADSLLQEAECPAMILLTGNREQFDLSTAI